MELLCQEDSTHTPFSNKRLKPIRPQYFSNEVTIEYLVERTEDLEDRRRTMIRLSRRGEELISRLRQGREERNPLPAWLAKLSDQDLRALVQGLRALAAEAHAATGESLPLHSWSGQHG